MNSPEILQYHKDLASLLNSEPNCVQRRAFLAEERKTPEYQAAKRETMNRIEHASYSREEQLVENVLAPIFNDLVLKEKAAGRARSIVEEYSGLPKRTVGHIKEAKKLIRQAAGELLQNPQDIGIACLVWERHDSFYTLVKEESKTLIRERWETITPEQLAELVRIYANNPQAKDFAKDMLTSYFNRKSMRQRIHAYYTFVFSVLDLVGEDKAFNEGVRIGLFDTDILPKDPNLVEATILLSLPYNEEIAFQKLLIAKSVMAKLSFLSSEDLEEVRQKYSDFMNTDKMFKKKWDEAIGKMINKIGFTKATELNQAATACNVFQKETLSEEEKRKIKNIWPYNLLLDETDPLNQKFKKVFPQIAASKTINSSCKPVINPLE